MTFAQDKAALETNIAAASFAAQALLTKLGALETEASALTPDPVVTPPPPPPPTKPAVGWFHGAPDACPVPYTIDLDFAYDIDGAHSNGYTQAAAQAYTNAGKRLMLKVGLMTDAEVASMGAELVAGGQTEPIIPIMWEGNQDVKGWFTNWNETAETAAQFKANFNRMCADFRAVPGLKPLFVWCPNVNNAGNQAPGRTQFDTDPGPAADVVLAPDGYDSPKGQWTVAGVLGTYQAYYAYAQAHGWVFAGLCEWGANGWDDGPYVAATLAWLGAIGAQWQVYFSASGTGVLDSQLSDKPTALAAYKAGV